MSADGIMELVKRYAIAYTSEEGFALRDAILAGIEQREREADDLRGQLAETAITALRNFGLYQVEKQRANDAEQRLAQIKRLAQAVINVYFADQYDHWQEMEDLRAALASTTEPAAQAKPMESSGVVHQSKLTNDTSPAFAAPSTKIGGSDATG